MVRASIVLCCFAGLVQACSCEVFPLAKERRVSREIFQATVALQDQGVISLRVDRVWKGNVHAEEKIWVDPMCSAGPSDLKVGEEVLVFAMERRRDSGVLHDVFILRGCTRTARVTQTKDVAKLGRSHPPSEH
jgi:hypothetical protein